MKTLLTIALLLFLQSVFAQKLIRNSKKVETSFEKLMADSNNLQLQKDYIADFPPDSKTFLKVFQPKDLGQLYPDYDKYFDAIKRCSTNFPKEIIDKFVDIGKSLVWQADATGELQQISIDIATNDLQDFIIKFKTLKTIEQDSLTKFYADAENFKEYPEYQNLINKLDLLHETGIARKFEDARRKRIQLNDN